MNRQTQFLHSGFSLVELSVAMAVFSMGLGSLSIMLLAAIHGTAEARHETVAAIQADSLAEVIAMSSDAYGHYINPPGPDQAACEGDSCNAQDLASANLTSWHTRLRKELPGGTGLVCRDSTPADGNASDPLCDGNGTVVVKVFWSEPGHEDSEDGGLKRLVSRLPW